MRIRWELDTNTWSATAFSDHSPIRYHLVVERLPDQHAWDWTVWRGAASHAVRIGTALDALTAMEAAEASVRELDNPRIDT